MGLFCGKRCKCKRRCKSYFSEQPDLERACSKACSDNDGLDRDTFLCSGKYIDQQQYMLSYGHDPCPYDNINMEQVLDPLDSEARNEKRLASLAPILIGVGAIILIGIVAFAWTLKK